MRAGIAMGSNVGDRLGALVRAKAAVLQIEGVSAPCLASSLYETEPVGTEPDAGRFINAVIEIGYSGLPASLLEALQEIEASMGRPSKRPRNAPRTIDLDLLLYGDECINTPALDVPHPRMVERAFVLVPLAEIAPDLVIPGAGKVRALLPSVADQAITRLS